MNMDIKDYVNLPKLQKGDKLNKRLYKTIDPTKPYPTSFSEKVQHVKNFITGKQYEVKDSVSDAA
ncbi:MAG: hypothetical protein PQJ44_01330 [Sphaerochaetaceae bacterium]|nr:hypothetical protein [Sphaerochaetaceae bacterium]